MRFTTILPRLSSLRSTALGAASLWWGLLLVVVGPEATIASEPEGAVRYSAKSYDVESRADANQLDMFITNLGSFAWDLQAGAPGLEYPRGTGRTAVYAAGLWLGATVGGQPRVTVAQYSCEYTPGRILSPTSWDDPYDPAFRVYKIAPGDNPSSNPDYAEWPAEHGAPVDGSGNPRHLGAQTLWSVYHDLDYGAHTNAAGGTPPLGVEVRHASFAYDWVGAAATAVLLEWTIINRGSNILEDVHIGLWADPDLGGPTDDLVACDPPASLGYCYNADGSDLQYGSSPPAVGLRLVQGPIVPSPGDEAFVSGRIVPGYRNLPLTAFVKYINGTDPPNATVSYRHLQGLNPDGSPVIDPSTGQVTTFMVSGDPVAGQGWLDTDPADRRMMLSSGPFSMAPGDTQIVAAVVIVGQGADRLASITDLRALADRMPLLFRSAMGQGDGACCLAGGACVVSTATGCLDGEFIPGAGCDPNPCLAAAGACCFSNGTCLIRFAGDCAGSYQGDGTTCTPDRCAVYGPPSACCRGSGVCEIRGEEECLALGGTYLPDEGCELLPPGDERGWQRNHRDQMMIDEIAGAGGVSLPADGQGGPGNDVWHSYNSTGDWLMSAGGGDGGEDRFTRGGADIANLDYRDLILRWDLRPDNVGWWMLNNGEAGPVPFGLYERDPFTGEEVRLLPVFTDIWSPGIYDFSPDMPDPYSSFPATDWCYAYRIDPEIATWEEIVLDAQDGDLDTDPVTDELFARMIIASPQQTMPAEGTVIQFSTKKSGILVGSGFEGAVPLAWPVPAAGVSCIDAPLYDIFRDSVLLGTTPATDYLDHSGLAAGKKITYRIRTRNPYSGQTSDPSIAVEAVPGSGYSAASGPCGTAPLIDGTVDLLEWDAATPLDATLLPSGPPSTIRVMNDAACLYLALEDAVSAEEFRIYIDVNGNGIYDAEALEGMITLDHGTRRFTRLQGVYPDVAVLEVTESPPWLWGEASATVAEVALSLDAGPLAGLAESAPAPLFFHAAAGAAVYPPGPPPVLAEAPALFVDVTLSEASGGVPPEGSVPAPPVQLVVYPNPTGAGVTISGRVPRNQRIDLAIFDVKGGLIRRLEADVRAESAEQVMTWDGTDAMGREAPSGVYYLRLRGETVRVDRTVILAR